MECDDYWCDEEKLQLQIDALEQNPDCSYCSHNSLYVNVNDIHRENEDGNLFIYNRKIRNTGKYNADDFKPLYGAGWANHSNSRVIRMNCVDLDELSDIEDFLYDNSQFFYLLQRGNMYYIQRVMSVYVMNMSSAFTSLQVQKKISGHFSRMLHINESTNHEFERLIYRHLGSFAKYWFRLDDYQSKLIRFRSEMAGVIQHAVRKLFYDTRLHHMLRKQAKKNIKQLQKKVSEEIT